jgi:hypothetical protein
VRIIKSGLLAKSDLDSYFAAIATAQETVDRCSALVSMQGQSGLMKEFHYNLSQLTKFRSDRQTQRVEAPS